RDLVDRSCDQGFCGNTAITLAHRMLQYCLRLGPRFADVNIAPQDDGARLPPVSGAALTVDSGLRPRLLIGEAGACDPAFCQPCSAVDGRGCAGADPDLDGLGRTQRQARFGDPEPPGRTHRLARQEAPDNVESFLESRRTRPN